MHHIVSAFRLVEAQNHGASIRKPLAIEYTHLQNFAHINVPTNLRLILRVVYRVI
jgi:hypothetical protein